MIIVFDHSKKSKDLDKIKLLYKFSSMEKFSTKTGVLQGIAVPYNEQTDDWRKMAFAPNSFKNLKKVSSFVNHESWDVRSMIGASEFIDTKNALKFKMTLNMKDPDVVNKVIPLIEMGALEGVSIGAYVYKREIEEGEDNEIVQITITEAEIYELSIVTFQAFENAKIEANKESDMSKKNKGENKPIEEKIILSQEGENDNQEEQTTENQEETIEEESVEEESAEEETPTEEDSEESEDGETEESETEEDDGENSETGDVESVENRNQMSIEDFQSQLKAKDEEIAKLKKEKTDSDKKTVVKELIKAGIVHKAHEERVINKFESAESIQEFYKGIPAAFSVEPKGIDSVDLTSDDLKSEKYKQLAKQTSLKEEDYEKYNK